MRVIGFVLLMAGAAGLFLIGEHILQRNRLPGDPKRYQLSLLDRLAIEEPDPATPWSLHDFKEAEQRRERAGLLLERVLPILGLLTLTSGLILCFGTWSRKNGASRHREGNSLLLTTAILILVLGLGMDSLFVFRVGCRKCSGSGQVSYRDKCGGGIQECFHCRGKGKLSLYSHWRLEG